MSLNATSPNEIGNCRNSNVKQRQDSTPVLIAGGGASGTIMALLLAQQEVASIILEARNTPYDIPRAHALNPRSLEICAGLGLDIAEIRCRAAPRREAGQVRFVTRLFGPEWGCLPYERQDDEARLFTPEPLVNVPQTEFEALLFEAAEREPLIEVRRGHRWVAIKQETAGDGAIHSTVEDAKGTYQIASRFLIGCDGAGSAVRGALGIDLDGIARVQAAISIVFEADLRAALADRPAVLYWVTDPAARGTFIAYHMDRLWSFVQTFPPGMIDMSSYDEAACRRLVVEAAGGPIDDLKILHISPWTMTAQVADRFGRGNVLLVGDAAHRFPPTGGLGLNTGIQDAHNLAWKIGAVMEGWGSRALIDSYEQERRPVALRNRDQSLVNAQRLAALAAMDCEQSIWQNSEAFAQWLDAPGRRDAVADAISLQSEHFNSFGLQLGFAYPPHSNEPEDVSDYRPSAAVGHRLPHATIGSACGYRSTLDLADPHRFTILVEETNVSELLHDSPIPASPVRLSSLEIDPIWRTLVRLDAGDALIVRPDGHVGWRGPVADVPAALLRLSGAG